MEKDKILDQSPRKRVKPLYSKQLVLPIFLISMEEVLGSGSFGQVYRCYNPTDLQEKLACKVISKTVNDQFLSLQDLKQNVLREDIQAELDVLSNLEYHPNIVNYKRIKIGSNENQYLIMEYCNGGTLQQQIMFKRMFFDSELLEFLYQFSLGYTQLLKNNIIHHYMRIFFSEQLTTQTYKISDFGLATLLRYQSNYSLLKGTPMYLAPEYLQIYQKEALPTNMIDMFSLGVVLYQMAYNQDDYKMKFNHPYLIENKLQYQDNPLFLLKDLKDLKKNYFPRFSTKIGSHKETYCQHA